MILPTVVEFYDISVHADMFVKCRLQLQLFLLDPTISLCIALVDEFDGKDGGFGVQWCGFLDATMLSAITEQLEHDVDEHDLPCVCS